MRIRRILAAMFAAWAGFGLAAAQAAPVDSGHVVVELVPSHRSAAPGQTIYLAVKQTIDKGWHTYWRNAGDSGEATSVAWTLPAGWSAGDIVWPAPTRQPTGPLMNFGYQGEVLLPVPITAPADAVVGGTAHVEAKVSLLVCEEICVPESATLVVDLPVTATPEPDAAGGPAVERALAAAPRPADLTAAFAREGQGVKLGVAGPALEGLDPAEAFFFPFEGGVIENAAVQAIDRGPGGLTLTLTPGAASGPDVKALAGVLSVGGKAFEVEAAPGVLPAGSGGLGPPPRAASAAGDMGLALAAAFAFLGGLILNLMPCVFPVLAMKAAGLAAHAQDPAGARREGLFFLAGVLATFLALAGALIALQAGGAAVGWGFQLQSPATVAVLALLMLAVGLNLSGVFEAGASLQGVGGGLAARGGAAGAFFTGALAVVVAAPCTAPFMAPALGWALTQPPVAALAVFAALGLGFAAPFVAVAYAPGLLGRLPRPGPWMATLRSVLAFPMYAAAAWLAWVLTVQAGADGLARLLAAAVVAALAAWLAGRAQHAAAQGRRAAPLGVAAGLTAAACLAFAVWPPYAAAPTPGKAPAAGTAAVASEPYSPERLAALRAEGRPVFVDYTAAWCVTCQVNEKVALSTRQAADAFAETGAVLLKADWTNKNPEIARELAEHGRPGVPLYLVYGAGGRDAVVLPQLLSDAMVAKALRAAAKP